MYIPCGNRKPKSGAAYLNRYILKIDGVTLKMDLKNRNKCPSCENTIEEKFKLKLLKSTEIRCPYCAKDLRISESKAFLVTTPLLVLFALGLHKYTDMSNEMALVAIVTFVVASYYPSRSIEILLTKLKLVKH